MKISEIKAKALKALEGNWKPVVLMTLIFYAIIYAASFIGGFTGGLISIAILVIQIPLEFGLIMAFMKVKRKENVEVGDFFGLGFKNFGRSWGLCGNTLLKMIVPLVLVGASAIILGIGIAVMAFAAIEEELSLIMLGLIVLIIGYIAYIGALIWVYIKSLAYAIAMPIAIDNPEMTTKQAVEKSAELMKGYKGKFFGLNMSFIGWAILSIFTLGIGVLWLIPYIQFSILEFYEMVSGKQNVVEATVIKEEN